MSSDLVYQHIGLTGFSVGTVKFSSNGVEWRDRGNVVTKQFECDQSTQVQWTVYGVKGHIYIHFDGGKYAIFDGFAKDDYDDITTFFKKEFGVTVEKATVSTLTKVHIFI